MRTSFEDEVTRNETVKELAQSAPIHNILMATDFSSCSRRALGYAISIAKRSGATLHLFHWVDPAKYAVAGADMLHAATEATWHDLQQLDADLHFTGLLQGTSDQILTHTGDLSPVLSRVIAERQIDLVVVGTHGRTGLRKVIMGSVAERIFRQASCPVLTVGPMVRQLRSNEGEPRTILFPTDFSLRSKAAEPYAFSLARASGYQLMLLHALEHQPQACFAAKQELQEARRKLNLISRREGWASDELSLQVKIGPAADVILRMAEEHWADLIVLGVRSPYYMSDRLMWPNAYRIMYQSSCPVLTVRTPS